MGNREYLFERDAGLRGWEVFNAEDGGDVTYGIVHGEYEKCVRILDKVYIPDDLLHQLNNIKCIKHKEQCVEK